MFGMVLNSFLDVLGKLGINTIAALSVSRDTKKNPLQNFQEFRFSHGVFFVCSLDVGISCEDYT